MTYRRLTIAQADDAAAVSRRDFLKLRLREGRRVLELSCESLYMRYHDARSGAGRHQVSNHDDFDTSGAAVTGLAVPTADELFAELDRQLAQADELRVLEYGWIGGGAFGHELGERLQAFRERGGRVEFSVAPASAATGAPRA